MRDFKQESIRRYLVLTSLDKRGRWRARGQGIALFSTLAGGKARFRTRRSRLSVRNPSSFPVPPPFGVYAKIEGITRSLFVSSVAQILPRDYSIATPFAGLLPGISPKGELVGLLKGKGAGLVPGGFFAPFSTRFRSSACLPFGWSALVPFAALRRLFPSFFP